jgi:electron transfer flavoprotein beta subunit
VRIVVCLHAPRKGEAELGGDDTAALARAMALASPGEHVVTAMLAGGASEDGPLRRALAAGASRAVRLAGQDFASSDFHTLGQVLATGIKRIGGADLVLTGARSDDDGLGAVPAALARQLGALHVACIESLSLAKERSDAVEIAVRGGGKRRLLRVSLPAVLSVSGGGPERAVVPKWTGDGAAIEVISLVDPEATVVRRRTELLGQAELPTRATEDVTSATAFVAALRRA